MKKTVGFIGLGIMGKPMAKNLIDTGYSLVVYDITADNVKELVDYGAKKGLNGKDVASKSQVVITMLPNSPHVKTAVLGGDGILDGAAPGTIVVDMSSIAPLMSKEVGGKCEEKLVKFIDAPVSGGEPKAIDGTLSIMVGGDKAVFEEVLPILEVMGSSATYCGELGSGNATKLANQIVVATNIAGLSEALILGKKIGVDPEAIFQAIRGGLAGSTVMEAKAPMMLSGNFDPGFRINLHIKDLNNVIETGHSVGAPLPLSTSIMEMMQWLKAQGKDEMDHSALILYYENLANTRLKDGSLNEK